MARPAGLASQVVGHRRTLVYHRLTRANAARMAGTNRVAFSAARGQRAGCRVSVSICLKRL